LEVLSKPAHLVLSLAIRMHYKTNTWVFFSHAFCLCLPSW